MLHLLPTEYLKNLRREYVLRFGTVSLFLIGVVLLVGAVSLLPAYFELVSYREDNNPMPKNENIPQLSANELKEYKKNFEDKLEIIEVMKNHSKVLALEAVTENLVSDVSLVGLDLEFRDGENGIIQIKGESKTRLALSKFVEGLKSSPKFNSVDAPLSLFAKDKDIPFTISVVLSNATSTTP